MILLEFPDSRSVGEGKGVIEEGRRSPVKGGGLSAEKPRSCIVAGLVELVEHGVWMTGCKVPRVPQTVRWTILWVPVSTLDVQAPRSHGSSPPMLQDALSPGFGIILVGEAGYGLSIADPE